MRRDAIPYLKQDKKTSKTKRDRKRGLKKERNKTITVQESTRQEMTRQDIQDNKREDKTRVKKNPPKGESFALFFAV